VAERLAFLGVAIDPAHNGTARNGTTRCEITATGAAVRTLVVPAREDLEIAAGTRRALRDAPARPAPARAERHR
jgi:acetate kinase